MEIFDKADGDRHAGKAVALAGARPYRGPVTQDRSDLIS